MLGNRSDVEFLASIGTVAVPYQAHLLQNIQRAVDGRRDDARVEPPTAIDELRAGDVATRSGEDLDDRAALRRPAQTALTQPPGERRPGLSK